jgi:hypothetical protein
MQKGLDPSSAEVELLGESSEDDGVVRSAF